MTDDVRNIVLGVTAADISAALGRFARTYLWKRKLPYVARRTVDGWIYRDAQRCLKRAMYRQIFKIVGRSDRNRLGNVEEGAQAA
ncbi:hypothetical protein [Streptomyces flaveolus]|uniref:hypothetical protein n=1 Tax=Streptomyces flaveolus TaxID=67297 RepID=UPI0036FD6FE9